MRASELAMTMSGFARAVDELSNGVMSVLEAGFEATTDDNEKASAQASMHKAMCSFLIVSQLSSTYKKAYDKAKVELDESCTELGIDHDVEGGEGRVLFQDNLLAFHKKRNVDGTQTALKDFSIELTKLGIDKETIDKAMDASTKSKRGSVYYTVSLAE
tara:strand:- start:849 stop:1325 length:477 start_codon:yes stop_codon:yes gene_type:complete